VSDKTTGVHVIYNDDPVKLVSQLVDLYQTKHFEKPSCFCEDRTALR